jgi:ABC-2 type transport system permease protein
MKVFWTLLVADLRQFFREKTALFFTFGFPLLFMLIFGLVFSGSQDVSYNISLVDQDASTVSGQISGALKQINVFKVTEGSYDDELARLKKGDIRALLVIPAGTQAAVTAGKPADITVHYDPTQTTSSQIILSVLSQATEAINQQLTRAPVLLQLRQESVQAHNLRNIDYLVPGILAMAILFLGLFGSLTLVDWRERKILKRFAATPISTATMIYSQVGYRLILALLQALLIIAVAYFVFKVSVLGNWLLLFGLVVLGTLTFISIGYFVVSRAKTTEGAMPIIQLVQFPMLFLSGIFFPIDVMPAFMRPVVQMMPLTYLGDAFRQVMVGGTPLYPLAVDVAVLGGWLVLCIVLAIKLFRWE